MSFEDLDDDRPFEPDASFRTSVRRRGQAMRRRRRGVATAVLASPLLVALVGLAWVDHRLDGIDRVDLEVAGPPPGPGEPVDILVVGTDARTDGREPDEGGEAAPGPRADAIALVRLDASRGEIRVLPIPRDLLLPSLDPARPSARASQVLARDSSVGLVSSIERSLTVDGVVPAIDHYAELDTAALAEVVDLAGGVPVVADAPVRDLRSGARLDAGCQVVDGVGFGALTRSRSLESFDGSTWRDITDGQGDLHRMGLNEALGEGLVAAVLATDPGLGDLHTLLGPVVDGLVLDEALTMDRLLEWARWARTLPPRDGPHGIVTVHLPVASVTLPDGAVVLEQAAGWQDAVTAWSTGDPAPSPAPPSGGSGDVLTESGVVEPEPGTPIRSALACD